MTGERYVQIGEETTFGTAPASMAKDLSIIELDLTPDQGRLMEFETGYWMKNFSVLGPFVGSGRLMQYARPHAIGYFLKWALGSVTPAQVDTSTVYDHTFEQDLSQISSFTLNDVREIGTYALQHLGCLIKTLTIEAPAREIVTMEADIQYRWEQRISKPTATPTFENIRPFVFSDSSFSSTEGLTVNNIEAFRFQISNSIPDDIHDQGSRKIPEILIERSEWTVELDLKWKSWEARQEFWGGTGAGTEPADEEKEYDLTITLTGAPTNVGVAPNYLLTISLPRCIIKEQPAPISRRDRLTQRIILEVLQGTNQITLRNTDSAY